MVLQQHIAGLMLLVPEKSEPETCEHYRNHEPEQCVLGLASSAVRFDRTGRDRKQSLPSVLVSFRAEISTVEQPRIQK